MLSTHGKQYNQKREAMTNQRISDLNTELTDLSNNTDTLINTIKGFINGPNDKMTSFMGRDELSNKNGNIYTGNNFKDVCGNYFHVNSKGVIKKYSDPSSIITSNSNMSMNNKNLTTLSPYDEISVSVNDTSYNLIKGTDIVDEGTIGNEGKYIFSNKLLTVPLSSISGDCYTLKSGNDFLYDLSYNNETPNQCKQLAIDNYYKHYILRKDTDGSLNCYLSNDFSLSHYDISAGACHSENNHHIGKQINQGYGIYNNNNEVGSKEHYYKGGYIDFDSNFVNNTNNNFGFNGNYNTVENRRFRFEDMTDISCLTVQTENIYNGYIKHAETGQCYTTDEATLLDTAKRIYDASYNVFMKEKQYVESFATQTQQISSSQLSKYKTVEIPTFSLPNILSVTNPNLSSTDVDAIKQEADAIKQTNLNIYEELEKYNRILRIANMELSDDISLNMTYVGNEYTDLDGNLRSSLNIENIHELKRKLEDHKVVLNHNSSKYVLWSILGVATLILLVKLTKKKSNI